jgi:hypothetical protein
MINDLDGVKPISAGIYLKFFRLDLIESVAHRD